MTFQNLSHALRSLNRKQMHNLYDHLSHFIVEENQNFLPEKSAKLFFSLLALKH